MGPTNDVYGGRNPISMMEVWADTIRYTTSNDIWVWQEMRCTVPPNGCFHTETIVLNQLFQTNFFRQTHTYHFVREQACLNIIDTIRYLYKSKKRYNSTIPVSVAVVAAMFQSLRGLHIPAAYGHSRAKLMIIPLERKLTHFKNTQKARSW